MTATWHGDVAEMRDLTTAVSHNCVCVYGMMGMRSVTCPAHKAITDDQRFLDGLLWERRLLSRRCDEEFNGST